MSLDMMTMMTMKNNNNYSNKTQSLAEDAARKYLEKMRMYGNIQLMNMWREYQKPNWNRQLFQETATMLMQQHDADINIEFVGGCPMLYYICGEEWQDKISSDNQYELIIFMLEHGAKIY
jgi:hypothetical protein